VEGGGLRVDGRRWRVDGRRLVFEAGGSRVEAHGIFAWWKGMAFRSGSQSKGSTFGIR